MAVTISLYNHTVRRFLEGTNASGDTYGVNLYTALTFDATHTTKTQVDTAATQVSTANGYVQDTKQLANVTVTITDTNGAVFDADDVEWTATGGSIDAAYALIYNDTDADKPPVAMIDFDGTQSAGATTEFKLIWDANGIIRATVP